MNVAETEEIIKSLSELVIPNKAGPIILQETRNRLLKIFVCRPNNIPLNKNIV